MAPLGYKAPWPSNQSFITFVVPGRSGAAVSCSSCTPANETNGPTFAHAILTTEAVIAAGQGISISLLE